MERDSQRRLDSSSATRGQWKNPPRLVFCSPVPGKNTQDLAPRIHNLNRLAELAGLAVSSEMMDVLAEMNAFHIEGRYPETLTKPPTKEETIRYMKRTE